MSAKGVRRAPLASCQANILISLLKINILHGFGSPMGEVILANASALIHARLFTLSFGRLLAVILGEFREK